MIMAEVRMCVTANVNLKKGMVALAVRFLAVQTIFAVRAIKGTSKTGHMVARTSMSAKMVPSRVA
jgi:hypothetical protein